MNGYCNLSNILMYDVGGEGTNSCDSVFPWTMTILSQIGSLHPKCNLCKILDGNLAVVSQRGRLMFGTTYTIWTTANLYQGGGGRGGGGGHSLG